MSFKVTEPTDVIEKFIMLKDLTVQVRSKLSMLENKYDSPLIITPSFQEDAYEDFC